MPTYTKPGTKPFTWQAELEARKWLRQESKRLRLSMSDTLDIAVAVFREYVEEKGDARFMPRPFEPESNGNGDSEDEPPE